MTTRFREIFVQEFRADILYCRRPRIPWFPYKSSKNAILVEHNSIDIVWGKNDTYILTIFWLNEAEDIVFIKQPRVTLLWLSDIISRRRLLYILCQVMSGLQTACRSDALPLIARFMGTTWGPSGANRTQVGPMLAPWTLLSGAILPQLILP